MNHVLRPFLHRRFRILTPLTALCYVASKIPVDHFVLDLLDHLQSYYFLWFAVSLVTAMFYFKDKRLALYSGFFLVTSLLIAWIPLRHHITLSSGDSEKSSVKIASVNIYYGNKNYQDIEKFILVEAPDILVVPELSTGQQYSLGAFLGKHYPYRFMRPLNDPSGIGLYSRFPLSNVKFHDPAEDGFGYVSASVLIREINYNLLAVHPFPPILQNGLNRRNTVYRDMPRQLAQESAENIVIGDFNNTIWSPDFQAMMESLNVQVNVLTPATWPALTLAPKIAIDHILIPKSARFVSIRRGADIGSDHYPLVADIVL